MNLEQRCRKPDMIDGVGVQLGDGNTWQIPRLDKAPKRAAYYLHRVEDPRGPILKLWYRRWLTPWNGTTRRYVAQPSAFFVQDDPEIVALAEDARCLAEEAVAGQAVRRVDVTNFVFRVLALNYDITIDAVNTARLINESNLCRIIEVFIGIDTGNPIRHAVEVAFRITGLHMEDYSPADQLRIAAFFEATGMAPPSALSAGTRRGKTIRTGEDLIGIPNGE